MDIHANAFSFLDEPLGKDLWVYSSEGLRPVGQDEVVLIIEQDLRPNCPHRNVFEFFQRLYDNARKGK